MPEIYIGTDIVSISRIRSAIDRNEGRFLSRVFTLSEQEYCHGKANPVIHYAGRFSAKEAIMKAIKSSGWNHPIAFNSINIDSDDSGCPIVTLNLSVDGNIKVSISHTDEHAIAFAVFLPQK